AIQVRYDAAQFRNAIASWLQSTPNLVSITTGFRRDQRQKQDVKVESYRAVIDVIEVVIDPPPHRLICVGCATEAVDLRPARDAGLHVQPARILGDPFLEKTIMRDGVRTRPDERHLAS